MFPWFVTKTNYYRDKISTEYWEENLGGVERDWDESTYYLQSYELRSSRPLNWSSSITSSSTTSGRMYYNSQPSSGGWDGSYQSINESGYPVDGFLVGGNEQMTVYNFTYYMLLLALVVSIISIILIAIAGMGKVNPTVPKVIVVVAIILVVFAPLYFALALPVAIDTDSREFHNVKHPLDSSSSYTKPAEAGGIMGTANELDEQGLTRDIISKTEFSPGFGWWFCVAAIFTTIISIGFVSGKKPPEEVSMEERQLRKKYHEFDKQTQKGFRDQRQRDNGYYDDYQSQEYRNYNRGRDYGYDDRYRDDYYQEPRGYNRDGMDRGYSPPPARDYGRPPPRPPRRAGGYDYPPPQNQRRQYRQPPGY